MEIIELNGKNVHLSPRSITAKNEQGKTCGVCFAQRFDPRVLSASIVFEYSGKVKALRNLPCYRYLTNQIYIENGDLYLIYKDNVSAECVNITSYNDAIRDACAAGGIQIITVKQFC